MPESNMIEFEKAGKIYGPAPGRSRPVEALREVTLRIPRGGVWAVVGPNGAGKTTLFGLLLGFLHPTEGRVRVGGMEPRRYLRRHGAGYLPERFGVPGEWTVSSALRALARLEGLSAGDAARRTRELIERFGLEAHAGKPAATLSRGLNQRLGLAQALLGERELIVLDEPTEGLDPLWRIRLRGIVDELRAEGRTVLVASHDLAEVERLADHVIVLQSGRVREIFEVSRAEDAPRRYRITLAEPTAAMTEAFPDAVPEAGDDHTFVVSVVDARDLSARLAALLAAGAVVASVEHATEPLEEQVRRALSGGGEG